jgi:hypothetical protein
MILKEHPVKYTATEIRRAISRLETYAELNVKESEDIGTLSIIAKLKETYAMIPKSYRK